MRIPLTTSFNLHFRHLLSSHILFLCISFDTNIPGSFTSLSWRHLLKSCRSRQQSSTVSLSSDFGNRLRWPVPDLHNGVTHGLQPRIFGIMYLLTRSVVLLFSFTDALHSTVKVVFLRSPPLYFPIYKPSTLLFSFMHSTRSILHRNNLRPPK